MRIAFLTAAAAALLPAQPALAEVTRLEGQAFITRHVAEVPASPASAWAEMVAPGNWWDSEHTYSGLAANMTIDPRAGGCFCEVVPAGTFSAQAGSIEHMRVIYVMPEMTLRMTGGLGPLQSEPVNGVLTVSLEPLAGGGSRITWQYAVNGLLGTPSAEIAPLVDMVLGQQAGRLAMRLGATVQGG